MRGRIRQFTEGVRAVMLASPIVGPRTRLSVLRRQGATIGSRVTAWAGLRVLRPELLTIGDDAYINIDVTLDNSAPVVIGARAALAPGVLITTTNHDLTDPRRRQGQPLSAPVVIGEGAWIGARAVVLPGVTVGAGCVVAAGAVVTSDCKPNSVYAGVPARWVRDL